MTHSWATQGQEAPS